MLQNILDLVKVEYKKFNKNAAVQLLLGAFLVMAPFVILIGKRMFKYAQPPFPSPLTLFEFPTIWEYQAYVNHHLIYVLLGFFVILTITSEISYKTMRQNIITGYTKKEYFLAKLFSYVAIALMATILFNVSTIILGLVHTDGASLSLIFDNRSMGLRVFLSCMGFMTFAMLIAIWVRRSGIALFLYFAAIIFIEQALRGLHYYFFRHFDSTRYFPLNTYEDLTPLPLMKISGFFKIMDEDNIDIIMPVWQSMTLSTVYILLTIFIAWRIFKKKDV